ncbi:tRNA (guanosine(37)-N1)-methyltransferase TrmD [Anoxybacter fermentans]|uniref:tRNA (guanine-N(1)-)-methyltransferase n=1 Tax=Anoxybacter fermentans TaxID=1323375 RepID=A0A3S9SVT6_9FIRM|nr:tRNA (guanosine(37)-N1)-methyltransferase TrmD [Anoxybacter fermentans]AZR72350.1 tRNA (guanosine(37)-N1)-methyltransferase TrmD [Anoxybacter fermentans]
MVTFHILSIFPEMFVGVFQESILKRAQEKGLIKINLVNIRNYATDKHRTTDDYPYGGGPGMIMKVEPIFRAFYDITAKAKTKPHRIFMSPQGKTFNQKKAIELAEKKEIIILCGRYEGIDERIREELIDEEISIGDYVLTGGELPAMVVVDAVSRMIPGVLGDESSKEDDSFYCGLLGYPQYTRPREFQGKKVPDVLLTGNHALIERWRRKEALRRTLLRRPDLLVEADLTEEDYKLLEEIYNEEGIDEEKIPFRY